MSVPALASTWSQLWPNLLANAIWVPIAAAWTWAHHRWSKRHMQLLHDHIAGLREHIQDLIDSKEAS